MNNENSNDWEPGDAENQFYDEVDAVENLKKMNESKEENLRNVPHPICPMNMYFEGDEDKFSTAHCDFDTEMRRCTKACKIDVRELQKELDRIKPTKDKLVAMQENLGLGHRGKILLTTQERVDTNQEPIAKDIVDENYAKELVRRWNAFNE